MLIILSLSLSLYIKYKTIYIIYNGKKKRQKVKTKQDFPQFVTSRTVNWDNATGNLVLCVTYCVKSKAGRQFFLRYLRPLRWTSRQVRISHVPSGIATHALFLDALMQLTNTKRGRWVLWCTRVTDMQVRHNVSARHNQLPAKPPCRQQIELTFLWRSLPFANCMIPLWRNEGQVDASIDTAFIFVATSGMHLSHPQLLLDWRHQHVQQPVGGASHCFLLLEVNLDQMPPGGFFWKHCHMV
jgi:hypothetical protein